MHELHANYKELAGNVTAMKLTLRRMERRARGDGTASGDMDDGDDKDTICTYIPCSSVDECQTLNAKLGADPDLFKEAVSKLKINTADPTISSFFWYALQLHVPGRILQ